MRRVITLTAACLIAVTIVYMATVWRDQTTPPAPPDLTRVITLLDEATPTGQLAAPVAVPLPSAIQPTLTHPFFPLTDSHAGVACIDCHVDGMSADVATQCVGCHLADDIHNGANGSDCATCHAPVGWQFVEFDHSTIGDQDCATCHQSPPNHYPGSCNSCHMDTVNFFNVQFDHSFIGATDCVACHQPPPNHFQGTCSTCHKDTTNFRNATFNHTFPLNHGNANGVCTTCHVNNNTPAYTCVGCHNDTADLTEEHNDEGIFDLSNCVRCHWDGEEPDD